MLSPLLSYCGSTGIQIKNINKLEQPRRDLIIHLLLQNNDAYTSASQKSLIFLKRSSGRIGPFRNKQSATSAKAEWTTMGISFAISKKNKIYSAKNNKKILVNIQKKSPRNNEKILGNIQEKQKTFSKKRLESFHLDEKWPPWLWLHVHTPLVCLSVFDRTWIIVSLVGRNYSSCVDFDIFLCTWCNHSTKQKYI